MGDLAGRFQSGEEKEVGIVGEGYLIAVLGITLKDAELNDWRWVYRTAIRRC